MKIRLKWLHRGYAYREAVCKKFGVPTRGMTVNGEQFVDLGEATIEAMRKGESNDLYRIIGVGDTVVSR